MRLKIKCSKQFGLKREAERADSGCACSPRAVPESVLKKGNQK